MGCFESFYDIEQVVDEKIKTFQGRPLYISDIAILVSDIPTKYRTQASQLLIDRHVT